MNKTDNMSTDEEVRRRFRRSRVADCLDELHTLMMLMLSDKEEEEEEEEMGEAERLEARQILEKCDLLEATVDYLRGLRSTGSLVLTPSVTYAHHFKSGFFACAAEVAGLLAGPNAAGVDKEAARRILRGLDRSCSAVNSLKPNTLARINFEQENVLRQ